MRRIFLMWFCLCLGENSLAATDSSPRPEDFAYGAQLALEPNGALYTLTLPEAVYNSVVREDIGDLRIFNGLGEVVPHLLRRPPEPELPSPRPFPVIFSPLPNIEEIPKKDYPTTSVHIKTTATEAQIEVGKIVAPEFTAYLLDMRPFFQNGQWNHLCDLRLHWESTSVEGFVIPIKIETSADFTHWRPAGEGTLVDLPLAVQRLKRDILRPSQWDSYLRLSWKTPGKNITLTNVDAIPATIGMGEHERQWKRVTGIFTSTTVYEFESGGWMPIDRISVHLPQPNTMIMAELASHATPRKDSILRFRGALYDLTVNGITLRNEDITPSPRISNARFWRLTVVSGEGGLGSGVPELELGWVPHQLLFVARGKEPYQLAWGSSHWKSAKVLEAPLIQQLAANPEYLKVATMGASFTLAGTNALITASPPLPWLRILLWILMVFGVVVLGGMARQVYRRMAFLAE